MNVRRAALAAAMALVLAGIASGVAARAPIQRVSVTLRDFAIVLPARLRPGRTTFLISNRGHYPHNFSAIWGPVSFTSETVAPGRRTRLTVTLVPGAYVTACTLLDGGHIARGMVRVFTVGSRSPGSARWHYP